MKTHENYLKGIILSVVLVYFNCSLGFSQIATDPNRSLYVDNFSKYSANFNYINAYSTLGVDENHDGIFEKEDELLEFVKKSHITSLTLYDMNKVFKTDAPLLWNEIHHRFETLPDHLCRFITKAKSEYCVQQIYGAVGSSETAQDLIEFNQLFTSPTPAFIFSQAELSSPFLTQRLLVLAQSYSITDPLFLPSELAKIFLRAVHLTGCNDCEFKLDGFTTEYEFWNGTMNENDFSANLFEILLNDLDIIKLYNNSTYPNFPISINVYYGRRAVDPTVLTCPTCVVKYIDGCTSNCINSCTSDYCSSLSATRKSDRVYLEEYFRTTSGFNYSIYEDVFRSAETVDATTVMPIFSGENKINGDQNNFFGQWILDLPTSNEIRNMYSAEKIHYQGWNNRIHPNDENLIQPGGYVWFTSSNFLKSFQNPPLFYSSGPLCNAGNLDFTYIGPLEENIHYTFQLRDNANTSVASLDGYTPDFSVIANQGNFLPTGIPVTNSGSPYTAQISLDFGTGCTSNFTYSERIEVGIGAITIESIGHISPISVCEGTTILLKASSTTNLQWKKDGLDIFGATTQYYYPRESGVFTCTKTSGSCAGTSNGISVNFNLNPFHLITTQCLSPTSMILKSEVSTNVSDVLEYMWNTGDVAPDITISPNNTEGRMYYLTVTNPFNQCNSVSSYYVKSGNFQSSATTIAAAFTCNSSSGTPVSFTINPNTNQTAVVSDGITSRYFTWYSQSTIDLILSPGNYIAAVVEDKCSPTTSFTIGSQATYTFSQIITNVSCQGYSNGSISISGVSGGSSPYVFSWSGVPSSLITNTSNSTTVTGIPEGNYTLKISDGCNFQYLSVPVGYQQASFSVTASIIDASCNGGATGSINQTATTGSTFIWNSGATTEDLASLNAGVYTCTVSKLGCSQDYTYFVDQPDEIEFHIIESTPSCNGISQAGVQILVCGGTPINSNNGYIVSSPWSYVSASSNNYSIVNQMPGSSAISITDANSCVINLTVSIPGLPVPTFTVSSTNPLCSGGTGSIQIANILGTGPYEYSIDNGVSWFSISGSSVTLNSLNPGAYDIKVRGLNGCESPTQPVTISDPDALALTIASTNILCYGGNGSATATAIGGTAPITFLWSPFGGTSPIATNLIAGDYICTITDVNGCQETSTVHITEPPAISITPTTSSLCIGSNQNTITTSVTGGTGAYTYLWQPGLETTPGLSNLSQGNYGVTVLDQNGCSSTVSNITFTENQNCCGNLNNQMLNAPGPLATGSTYSGNNNLSYNATVTGTVTFSACTLKVAKNVSITINSGSTLNIVSGSILEACGDMWKGIIIEPGGTLNITNSTILDAENGALLRQNIGTPSSVTIENSSFGSNYIGIYMEPTTNQGFNAISLHLTNVTFDKPHPLKPSTNYTIGTTPYAGIQLNNWSGVIGKYGSTGNIYRNLNSGLRMNNCVVTVYAAQYINIIADPIYSGLFKGVGIFAEGGNSSFLLKEYGFGQTGIRAFENCDYGIYSQGVPVKIIGNLMENVRNGISLSNLPDGSFSNVQVNTINCIYTGITSQYHKEINGLLISGNIINVNNTTGNNNYGVGIGSYDYKKGSNTTIFANQINMGNGATGIEMWGVMGNAVYGNEIDFQLSSGTAVSGLSASVSDKNIISCNNVYGNTGTADVKQYGYYFSISQKNEVSCNTATEINYGFEFDGICNMANRYIGNTMRNNWTGLNFNSDGQIDEQWHRGNMWDNINGTFSSGFGAQNPVNSLASLFYVNQFDPTIYWPTSDPATGWFNHDPNGNAFDCEIQNVCGTRDNGDPTDISALEMMIANNTYNPADFPDESKWMARIFLFQKLMQQPDALSDPELLAFYNSNLNGNIEKINQIREQTAALYNKSSSDSTLLVNNDSLLQATMLSIENCEKAFSDGSITEQQYISTVTNLKQVISNILNSSKQIMALVKIQKDQTADNIRFLNTAVSTTEHYESNEKFVNDLYLRTAAKDNMQIDASDQSPLLSIAHECPFLGGEAVILARILYRLVNPFEEYDDYPLCHSLGLMRHRSPETKSGMESLIYPNPADNTATLVYYLNDDSDASLQIFDSSLKLSRSEKLNVKERQKKINLETLTPGFYIYSVVQNNYVVSSGKFSVVH